ncbi:amidohydrolase [Chromatocurvus halotolerans]|uniref:Amidohydrolase 3 domain-containing protein n=1 Tax=Chromatocurvus halotolerans TaxID=1132028 RepID=A0A4R2KMR9_9GAMM|nr:amidohydrolase [Chromatocurvus halotolerans]TCO75421.1 hypothetical protein EV688_109145 [Chromatocurvus halotolerans]
MSRVIPTCLRMTGIALVMSVALLPLSLQAQTLIENVHGYTLKDGERVTFTAMAFDRGLVTAIYTDPQEAAAATVTRRIDGAGATLLPGLIDAHGHVTRHGRLLASVDLAGVASEQAAAARVADFLRTQPGAARVTGGGWNQVLWPGKQFPHRRTLDAVSESVPIALSRVDRHALWVNSAALELADIDSDTPDPAGGQILRDTDGQPTGVLIDNAMQLVLGAFPDEAPAVIATHQSRALHDLARLGMTGVHDAGVTADELTAYRSLLARSALPIRVYAMLRPDSDALLAQGPHVDPSGMLAAQSVKISSDGALGSRGAALEEDYTDQPGHRGLLLLEESVLADTMRRAARAGFQVNTHAIGDRANRLVLDVLEQMQTEGGGAGLRHRVEHAQILRPQDLQRFAALGVIASIQPTHATSDMNMAADRLGNDRLEAAYAWQSLLESGARLAGGSDFPVEQPNPFHGLYSAVTRQDQAGEPPGGWLPTQKMTRDAALALFTEGAAFAGHAEDRVGRLLPGYAADFILVRDDYFRIPEADIWKNRVLSTWVGGEKVYEAGD